MRKFIINHIVQHSVAPRWVYKLTIGSKNWRAVTILWFVFYRDERYMDRGIYEDLYIHETTHVLQQIELLFIFQWILYFIHLGYGWIKTGEYKKGYRGCIFEVEANANEKGLLSVEKRPWFNWINFI